MRLPNASHEQHRWVISEIAPDFTLLDVWQLPARGRAEEFPCLIEIVTSLDPTERGSAAARALFRLRLRVGELLRWDESDAALAIPRDTDTTLAARLPQELRESTARSREPRPRVGSITFTPLYRTEQEWAGELSNRTVHGVLQLTWLEVRDAIYEGRMAVYVKPRGLLGAAYIAAIGPFRHALVYPAMLREIERAWRERAAQRVGCAGSRSAKRRDGAA